MMKTPLRVDPNFNHLRQRSIPKGLTPKEIAILFGGTNFGWSPKRVRSLIRAGKIPAISFGNRWFVDKTWAQDQLTKILAQREFDAITDEEEDS